MQTSFILDSDELNYALIDKLKVIFKDKRIELVISESDDTKHLLQISENKERLLKSIENIEKQENLIEADPELFK